MSVESKATVLRLALTEIDGIHREFTELHSDLLVMLKVQKAIRRMRECLEAEGKQ